MKFLIFLSTCKVKIKKRHIIRFKFDCDYNPNFFRFCIIAHWWIQKSICLYRKMTHLFIIQKQAKEWIFIRSRMTICFGQFIRRVWRTQTVNQGLNTIVNIACL